MELDRFQTSISASIEVSNPVPNFFKVPKDKKCPFCHRAFTSSSLGRHLDLYIRERNPKAPDGVHLVEEIQKIRGNVTRRHNRVASRRSDLSSATANNSPSLDNASGSLTVVSPTKQRTPHSGARQTPFNTSWEMTGFFNGITARNGSHSASEASNATHGAESPLESTLAPGHGLPGKQMMMKAHLELKQRTQEALDTARAAELALRESLEESPEDVRVTKADLVSLRQRHQIDMNSMPFDFEPLSLDFPALTLQCLQTPPSLYSSTPWPTAKSWSISPPDKHQFEALKSWFSEEFKKWRIRLASATAAIEKDLPCPPSKPGNKMNNDEAFRKAETIADGLEEQIDAHLHAMYGIWEQLPEPRRQELWMLELARSVGRNQKEVDQLKEALFSVKQENRNQRAQIEQLNCHQQPREFKLMTPSTLSVRNDTVDYILADARTPDRQCVGYSIDDCHSDLNEVVGTAIERWKHVVVANRVAVTGMNGQRSLPAERNLTASGPRSNGNGVRSAAVPDGLLFGSRKSSQVRLVPQLQPSQAQDLSQSQPQPSPAARLIRQSFAPPASAASSTDSSQLVNLGAPAFTSATPGSAGCSGDEDMSDQDADADQDVDGLAEMDVYASTNGLQSGFHQRMDGQQEQHRQGHPQQQQQTQAHYSQQLSSQQVARMAHGRSATQSGGGSGTFALANSNGFS